MVEFFAVNFYHQFYILQHDTYLSDYSSDPDLFNVLSRQSLSIK